MKKNYSPWLYQLDKNRSVTTLTQDIETQVAIIGAGIAGISSAFFILKNTDKNVTILERYKLGHGATGHNAGQVVSYFERGFASLVDEFGLELSAEGQRGVEDAWELLDEMYTEANLSIPFSRFLGHAGLANYNQVLHHLKNNLLREQGKLHTERILVSESAPFVNDIPNQYKHLYTRVPHEQIISLLEVKDTSFVAVVSYQKGCINSALFCEEMCAYLLQTYPDRFAIFEHTSVQKVVLRHQEALLATEKHTIQTQHVVLCTNGFESVTIFNETGLDINTKFHHMIEGTVGYMSGYLELMNKQPTAISYLESPKPELNDPYFYLTRRIYEYEGQGNFNLISVGGPEASVKESKLYSKDDEFPDEIIDSIDTFLKNTYDMEPNRTVDYIFTWHGLMGYTKNRVRLIGCEPKNPVLLYNLGCNGVGILPSIYGGKRLSQMLAGNKIEKSIFDVPSEFNA